MEHFTGENTFVWFCQVPLFGTDRPQSYCHSVRRYHNQMGKSTHKNCSLQNMNLAYWKKKKAAFLCSLEAAYLTFFLSFPFPHTVLIFLFFLVMMSENGFNFEIIFQCDLLFFFLNISQLSSYLMFSLMNLFLQTCPCMHHHRHLRLSALIRFC